MSIFNQRYGFETNSSSSHSLSIYNDGVFDYPTLVGHPYRKDVFFWDIKGDGYASTIDKESRLEVKASYAISGIFQLSVWENFLYLKGVYEDKLAPDRGKRLLRRIAETYKVFKTDLNKMLYEVVVPEEHVVLVTRILNFDDIDGIEVDPEDYYLPRNLYTIEENGDLSYSNPAGNFYIDSVNNGNLADSFGRFYSGQETKQTREEAYKNLRDFIFCNGSSFSHERDG